MKNELEQLRKELNDKIDSAIKSLTPKQEFEKDVWYYFSNSYYKGGIFKIGETINNRIQTVEEYGSISGDAERSFEIGSPIFTDSRPATKEEIQTALEAEAKKRGFKEGCSVDTLDKGVLHNWGTDLTYNMKEDKLYGTSGGHAICYQKGVFAKIITEPKIMIGGYEVKFEGVFCNKLYPATSIDGYTFTKDFWQAAKLISEHTKAKIMVGCSKQFDVSLETINQILEKLK